MSQGGENPGPPGTSTNPLTTSPLWSGILKSAPDLELVRKKVGILEVSKTRTPSCMKLGLSVKNMFDHVNQENNNVTIDKSLALDTISSATDVINESKTLEERLAKLEADSVTTKKELASNKEELASIKLNEKIKNEYQRFADFLYRLEDSFYKAKRREDKQFRLNFTESLREERFNILQTLEIESYTELDLNNEEHHRVLEAQPCNKELMEFYRAAAGADLDADSPGKIFLDANDADRFYLDSVEIRLKRNTDSHSSLPIGIQSLLNRIEKERKLPIVDETIKDAYPKLLNLVEKKTREITQ